MPGNFKKLLAFSILVLTGVAGLLYLAEVHRFEDYTRQQTAEARYAVNQAAALIGQEVVQLQRSVELFARAYREQIDSLIDNPDDDRLYESLLTTIEQTFPGAFNFMISDSRGELLLVDYEGLVGDMCRRNIIGFAENQTSDLRVHPASDAYHFDIMTPFTHGDRDGVFFISFYAGKLSYYLEAPPGHQLILVHSSINGLIELTTAGSRDLLRGVSYLNDSETDNVLYRHEVPSTSWELVDILLDAPSARLDRREHLQSLMVFSVFALVTLVALLAIYHDDRRLEGIMRELEKHKHELEERINQRTGELREANQELHRLSTHDSLTGVANRRHFDTTLDREVHRNRRDGQPLSLLMIDVDHFKAYNDSLGHLAGDECLVEIATILSTALHRSSDLVARYGGEEFVVVMPGVDEDHAADFAEHLRLTVQKRNLPHPASPVADCVTISIGVASSTAGIALDADDLVGAADRALYEAKSRGRNNVQRFHRLQAADVLHSG